MEIVQRSSVESRYRAAQAPTAGVEQACGFDRSQLYSDEGPPIGEVAAASVGGFDTAGLVAAPELSGEGRTSIAADPLMQRGATQMRRLDFGRYALGSCVAASLLVGCGGSQSALAPTRTQQYAASGGLGRMLNPMLNRLFTDKQPLSADQKMHRDSYVNAGAKAGSLVYISDTFAGVVYIFAWHVPGFERGTYMGQLGDPLTEPLGVCVDKKANVYVTNFNGKSGEIFEWAHGAVGRPSHKLLDPGNVPFSCAVDEMTGNIAVANLESSVGGPGSVYVYPGGKGPPVQFRKIGSPPTNAEYFVGYDDMGHLFADGSVAFCTGFATCGAPGDVQIEELPSCCPGVFSGPLRLKGVNLSTIQWPGAIVWDGRGHLDVGDREAIPATSGSGCVYLPAGCAALYGTKIGSGQLTQKTLTLFDDTGSLGGLNNGDVAWGVRTSGSRNIVPNGSGGACVQIYLYPRGGSEIGEFGISSCVTPFSAVVSP